MVTSLYVHVPFCAHKCHYCAFYSAPAGREIIDRYVEALVRELEIVASDLRPQTVFFGGGTPSLLNERQWERILQAMEHLHLLGATEWTVECNPATVSLEKAKLLRAYGVNRISMGVQSLDDALLKRLGRIHSRQAVFRSFDLLRRAGFDNLNLDLMFAIPGQSLAVWRETVREALALGSEHLACYEVIYEEDTALYAQLRAGDVHVDEDLACDMYEELVLQAENAGLRQYEIANFARDPRVEPGTVPSSGTAVGSPPEDISLRVPRRACRHNVNYWRGGDFHGLGPSATSYVRGVRTRNAPDTESFCQRLEEGRRPTQASEELAPLARAGETAAFGLRMVAGWPFDQFRQTTGYDLRGEWANEMQQLSQRGWGRVRPERFQLTRQGLRFADAAAELFLR